MVAGLGGVLNEKHLLPTKQYGAQRSKNHWGTQNTGDQGNGKNLLEQSFKGAVTKLGFVHGVYYLFHSSSFGNRLLAGSEKMRVIHFVC
jgi:hypothetical protein